MNVPAEVVTIASAIAAVAINALWEGALLVLSVWLLLRAWPGLNAATRYIVWCATLIATVVVPIVTTLPFVTTSPVVTTSTSAAARVLAAGPAVRHAVHSAKPVHATAPSAPQSPAAASNASPARLPERFHFTLPMPVAIGVGIVWLLLALWSFVKLAIGLLRLEQLKRDALPLPVEYRDAMQRWASANKGSREVRLCVSDEIDVPVAVGLFDSMILIPRALLEHLSENEVDQISLHELAHLRRADDWTNGLQRVCIALFAWNPAILFVGQQLDLEREVACDDWVLGLTGSVRPYALCLTKMAETSSWPYRPMPAPGVFATRKHISLRIERLLGSGRNIATSLSPAPAAVAVAIVGALALAMQLVAPSMAAPATPAIATESYAAAHPSPTVPQHGVSSRETTHAQSKVAAPAAPAAIAVAPPVAPVAASAGPVQSSLAPMSTIANAIPSMARHVAWLGAAHAQATAAADARSVAGVPTTARMVADASSIKSCSGCNLSGSNWAGKDMRGVNYTGADLSHSNLAGTDFSGGNFSGTDFSNSNLTHASFRNAHLSGCDFSHANLNGVDFTGATLSGCQFTGAQLNSADLHWVLNSCAGCDFARADLSGLDLSHIRSNGIDFSQANLRGANLSDSEFVGVDFSRAHLDGANLTNTTLSGCDLSRVDLTHVDLSRAKLIGTDLSSRSSPRP